MRTRARTLGAVLCALAMLATACRSQATVDLAETPVTAASAATAEPVPTPASPTPASPTPAPPTPLPEPTAVTPTEFGGQAPPAFDVPAGWDADIALDPAVFTGSLPNGMTYMVRGNDRPGSQAQLRLVVHAGSLNEEPGDEGAAHFLEHMMFNGTERFPGNVIVQVLEGFGSGFGPDVNAYTSFEETVYELEVPTRSVDTLQLGLEVLYQWATAATIRPDDVIAERGVVREEHRRSTEPLSGRLGAEIREVLLAGTPYLNKTPIGSADVIEAMTPEQLRAFYERWYRPELMTVVAVGDFDPIDVVQRIKDTFVQPVSTDPVQPLDPRGGAGPLPEPVFDVITDSEISQSEVEVLWRLSDEPRVSRQGLRSSLVGAVAMSMVNTRLFERLQAGDTVFLSANAGAGGYTSTTQVVSLTARGEAAVLDEALEQLLTEVERARQFGFDQAELDRALSGIRASVEQTYAERNTRQDESFAGELVSVALGRDSMPQASVARDVVTEVLDSLTVADAQRFLFEVLDSDPYVLITAPAADEAALSQPEELADIYDATVGTIVEDVQRSASDQTELMARPEPAAVIDEQQLPSLNATVVTYENGARLAFRQTQITENVVQLRGVSTGGFFAVEGPVVPLLDSVGGMAAGSGFESVDVVTLDRLLADSIASMSTYVGRAQEGLNGEASTSDLEIMLQLAHLSMTEPVITDLQARRFDERWRPLALNPDVRPETAGDLELWNLRYGDSPWFRLIPTLADLDGFDRDALLEAHKQRFANAGDFVFVVVGDFDPVTLVDLGARYLGTLPDDGTRETAVDRDPGLPEENLVSTVRAGIGDQGKVRINWESPYPFTLEADVTAQALELVVNARLRDLIREELGASYAPNAAVSVLAEPKSWVDTIIEVDSDPDRVEEVSVAIHRELERLRAGDFDAQYLDLAVEQLTESYRFFSNREWLGLLTFHVRYPERPEAEFRDRAAIAQALTVADIAAAAEIVFPASRSVEIWLVPAG